MKNVPSGSVLAIAFGLIVVAFLVIGTMTAQAAVLNGWAWSENFGWISFNSSDSGAGGGPYAVSVDSSGNWSGYAWSESVGWISFNAADVSGCPNGGAAGKLNKATGAVTGWARILSLGTDGCIELSGTNHTSPDLSGNSGVTYNSSTGAFVGYAWGGDTSAHDGIGWVQFNTNVSNQVVCLSSDCGYGGSLAGSCSATTPYQNIAPNTSVTFQATPTGGNGPYHYNWNGAGYDTQVPTNQFSASYSTSAPGPSVVIKDSNNLVSSNISCPAVTVLAPMSSSNIQIGRTVATANSSNLTVKQVNPFAITWNFTVTSDYSCSPSVSPDPHNSNWNSNWLNLSLNPVNNGDGTDTWSGNTGTNLTAGTAQKPVSPGIYQFTITCTSKTNPTQGASATLKVDSSSVQEI